MRKTSPHQIADRYREATGIDPQTYLCSAEDGAQEFAKATFRSKTSSWSASAPRSAPTPAASQPVRRFRQNRELRQVPAHHRDFIATMEPRTRVTIFINLVGKIFALRDRESLPAKKSGLRVKRQMQSTR